MNINTYTNEKRDAGEVLGGGPHAHAVRNVFHLFQAQPPLQLQGEQLR